MILDVLEKLLMYIKNALNLVVGKKKFGIVIIKLDYVLKYEAAIHFQTARTFVWKFHY